MFMNKERIIKKDTPQWILTILALCGKQILEREEKKTEDLALESFGNGVAGGGSDNKT